MIISASRRTDIPAFYAPWFMNRLREKYVLVKNPYNPKRISRVSLEPADIDCIVFWTRDPRPLIERWSEFQAYGIPYYFLYTITGYGRELEPNVPSREESVTALIELSRLCGPGRVIWRYDPIIFTDTMDLDFHRRRFTELASRLEGYTQRCIMSFIMMYAKCRRRLKDAKVILPDEQMKRETASSLFAIAVLHGMELRACAESLDLSGTGVAPAACIDGRLIESISGSAVHTRKDPGQRKGCGCVRSVDIGSYDTCVHGCRYCYAVTGVEGALRNRKRHDPVSPLLL